ncbi:MAG TPA: DUF5985 family protein [Verrucomicrobiae bacterium]|nr:DUF5985 family protein [Verrucomicrobiae bacterium]
MNDFISGILTMGYIVAGIFFLRFWRDTRDRLFAMFGAAFFILAVQRFGLQFVSDVPERATMWYFVRLLAFVIIIVAIVDKNRSRKK